ncbi:expressed unknown protein [Seminavis robusta]|uniref:Uncharacterized protein n=1 Tax=Seminavis robusta TaxID=568900 RepID=A0A9N8ELL7_9STRA|nr:expressed unknown protein [Seminavis robusta]|eukprot:Sro1171_g248830.1 n/a (149) ;mRNA; r:11059-11505
MDAFISQVATKTGIDESVVRTYIGLMLEFIQKKAPDGVTKEISANIPEAQPLIDSVSKEQQQGGSNNDLLKACMPILDLLKKLLAPLLGDEAKDAAEVTNIMTKAGVNPAQGGELMDNLLEFLKQQIGPDTVKQLTANIPALQNLMSV